MRKIIEDFQVSRYRLLKLDGELPRCGYSKYIIDGNVYDIVPVYDAPNCIAVESTDSFKGKCVEFS